MEELIVGGGCFWCVEAMFRDLLGVQSVVSGYAGGQVPNPTYKEVCSGATGHAEVIKITFDPAEIARTDLLRMFFVAHDPTTLNRQGGDVGTQYRSVVFYAHPTELEEALAVRDEIQEEGLWPNPIVTTFEPLTEFFPAEDYHQNYLEKFERASMWEKMNFNSGYCQNVVAPKVGKFRKAFAERLKRRVH